jgi:hypothetical protein
MKIIQALQAILFATSLTCCAVAHAQMYKCKNANGAVSYKDSPCANSESTEHSEAAIRRSSSALGNPDNIGLWETTMTIRPRVSHPKQNPTPNNKEMDELGDYKYFFGAPLKTVKCRDRSPIKQEYVWLSRACARQISAQGGTCTVNEEKDESGGPNGTKTKEVKTITGNYSTEITVKSEFTRIYKADPSNPVTDQSEIHIQFQGACKQGMKVGDEFMVEKNGEWVKPR